MAEKGYVKNCYLDVREGEGPLFVGRKDGVIVPHLDGYAIVPIEQFNDPDTLHNLEQLGRERAAKNEVH